MPRPPLLGAQQVSSSPCFGRAAEEVQAASRVQAGRVCPGRRLGRPHCWKAGLQA